MNPDKLFDYLDGKLSPAEREQLEARLMSDAQLRRQFEVARGIHRAGSDQREVIVPSEDLATIERSGRLGRRIATAAAALVMANVVVGLIFIYGKNRKPARPSGQEAEIRRQLEASLGAAAENAMPPPTFTAEEIQLTAPRAEWENIASRVIAASTVFEGTATKGLPEDNAMTVVADIPTSRDAEFRQAVKSAATIAPMPAIAPGPETEGTPSNARTIVQVRIAETAR